MPIQVTVELTDNAAERPFHLRSHRREIEAAIPERATDDDSARGPFRVATTGSSPPIGRLLFRYGDKETRPNGSST